MPLPSAGPQRSVVGTGWPFARHRRGDVDDVRLVGGDRERLLRAHAGARRRSRTAPASRRRVGGLGVTDERRGGEHRGQRGVVDRERERQRRVSRRVARDDLVGPAAAVAVFLQLPALEHRAARREHRAHVAVLDHDFARGRSPAAASARRRPGPTARVRPGPARTRSARSPSCCASARLRPGSGGGGGNIAW